MMLANLIRVGACMSLGAWLGCNTIIGLELGEAESSGSGGGGQTSSSGSGAGTGTVGNGSGGDGGQGAQGGQGSAGGDGGQGGNGGHGGPGGQGGGGGSGPCVTCSELIQNGIPTDVSDLCVGNGSPSSYDIWKDLFDCICFGNDGMPGTPPAGVCEPTCGDNLCLGEMPVSECNNCLADPAAFLNTCPNAVLACLNDAP
jgi:hypothetical protein